MRQYKNTEAVDAVVIGTGAGGAPLLARLAKRGLKVVALEAGPQWQPAADFATDERAQSKLFWNEERLSAGADPLAFGRNNSGTGIGGSTLHFTGYTPRPQPSDFRLYSDFGVGKDWPIGYTDLEPYYDELELFLGVSGPSPYPWGPPRNVSYPLPPLPLNGAAQLMARGCKSLHIKTAPAPNAILSAPYYQHTVGYRQACTNRGFCQAGCSTGAKGSTDVTFIPLAIHYGAEIRPECFAQTVERDAAGKITAVVYKRKGTTERQACRYLFLCAGAIETPRLLLLNCMANSSGQVGKNFMAHVGMQVWGKFQESVHPYKGVPATLISEDMNRPPGADFAGGYLLQSIGVMPVTYASQLTRATGVWGRQLREKMQTYNHIAGINMHGTCLPNQNNYLELTDEPDATGLHKPRIYFTAGENEMKLARHGEALMQQIWKEAGAVETFSYSRFAHTMGTCCMGKDRESAVVDAEGRSFDVPNLYICDNSVFPDSLTVNPALTIMALSLRTADLFLQRMKKGLEAKN